MQKFVAILYGAISYLAFLVAFLYAMGFAGNFIGPKTFDTGIVTPFAEALLINAMLLPAEYMHVIEIC